MEWRRTGDPYRIWLSEVLLQQTRVAAAAPYYRRFLERFPTVADLAAAPLDDVLKCWEGLGYYARARNLHEAARLVCGPLGGRLPDTAERLAALPGVGRSTACAIAAIAFGRDEAILDGNARRLLCRLAALRGDPRSAGAEKELWEHSRRLVIPGRGRETALAVMDLGATVCRPRDPACGDCPLREGCGSFRLGLQRQVPARRKGRVVETRRFLVAVVDDGGGRYLVSRRPRGGLLGGMAEFPTLPWEGGMEDPSCREEAVSRSVGFAVRSVRPVATVRRLYSHFRGEYLACLFAPLESHPPPLRADFTPLAPEAVEECPMGVAHRTILRELCDSLSPRSCL